jgi:hypothetical protein
MKTRQTQLTALVLIVILGAGSFLFVTYEDPAMATRTPDEWNTDRIEWTMVKYDESTNYILLDFNYRYENDIKQIKPVAFYKNPNQQIVFGTFDSQRILTAFQRTDTTGQFEGIIIYGIDEHNNEMILESYTKNDIMVYVNDV